MTIEPAAPDPSENPRTRGAYLTLMGGFCAFVGGLIAAVVFSGRKLPKHSPKLGELALIGVAAHKMARVITMARITSPLRAPFVTESRSCGEGEVEGEPRGEGLKMAVGELLTCPYCIGMWITTPMWFGMILAPRLTRFVAGVLTSVTIADFSHRAYLRAKTWGDS